jgi:hypothetical protein
MNKRNTYPTVNNSFMVVLEIFNKYYFRKFSNEFRRLSRFKMFILI